MEEKDHSDTNRMEDTAEARRIRAAALMRAERQTLERLKDLLHKYRVVLPYMSGRVKSLEERLGLLMSNRDEAQNSLAGLRSRLTGVTRRLERQKADIAASEKRLAGLAAGYNALLEGKFPAGFALRDEGASLSERKNNFMARLSTALDEAGKDITETEARLGEMRTVQKKLASRRAKLGKKAALLETKIGIYQKEVRDLLMEINSQARNEGAAMEEYNALINRLKEIPALSEWAEHVFREAVKTKLPPGRLIELAKPLSVRRLMQ